VGLKKIKKTRNFTKSNLLLNKYNLELKSAEKYIILVLVDAWIFLAFQEGKIRIFK